MKNKAISLLLFLSIPLTALSHSGRTDSSGGHYNRKTGEYHCHRGSCSGGIKETAAKPQARPQTASDQIIGVASVVDGDTIEIHGTRIRLRGIDAPESRQMCQDATGKDYRCGQRAALSLSDFIGRKTVSCTQKDKDRYGRIAAVCYTGGVDINGWMVRNGYALAYRQYGGAAYAADEAAAQSARAGIWQGSFDKPWDWRKNK